MLEVYTDNVFEYVGNVKNVAKYIGISPQTLYNIRSGTARWLPNKATCDIVVDGLNVYTKRPPTSEKTPVKERDIEVGFKITVKGVEYEIKDIKKTDNGYIYTINDLQIETRVKITAYNTLYIYIVRAIRKAAKYDNS